MPITFSPDDNPIEGSTMGIGCVFTDELGTITIPSSSIAWTLSDEHGAPINGRDGILVAAAGSIDIALYGDDLALPDPTKRTRVLTVETTYTSNLGSDLPLKDQARFDIQSLVAIS